MPLSIDLPDGHRAMLREPNQLRERHRRQILAAGMPLARVYQLVPEELRLAAAKGDDEASAMAEGIMMAGIQTRQEAAAMMELRDATIVALLQSWTVDGPLPNMDTIQDLDPETYAALERGTREFTPAVMEVAQPTDFSVTPRGKPGEKPSPFGGSGSSGTGSRRTGSKARSMRRSAHTGASTQSADASA